MQASIPQAVSSPEELPNLPSFSGSQGYPAWVLGKDTSQRDFLTSALLEFMVALANQHLTLFFPFLLTFSFIEKL